MSHEKRAPPDQLYLEKQIPLRERENGGLFAHDPLFVEYHDKMNQLMLLLRHEIVGHRRVQLFLVLGLFLDLSVGMGKDKQGRELTTTGPIFLEGAPGEGKTTSATVLGKYSSLPFTRIQCVSDIQPSDMIGYEKPDLKGIFNIRQEVREAAVKPDDDIMVHLGPILRNLEGSVILIDELPRASGRSQSGLLQVMGELRVTLAGRDFVLGKPTFFIATTNPREEVGAGVYETVAALRDRFFALLTMDPLTNEQRVEILKLSERRSRGSFEDYAPPFRGASDIESMRRFITEHVTVPPHVQEYIAVFSSALDPKSRDKQMQKYYHEIFRRFCVAFKLGNNIPDGFLLDPPSPRRGNFLQAASKVVAFYNRRREVTIADVQSIAPEVFASSLIPSPSCQRAIREAHRDERVIDIITSDTQCSEGRVESMSDALLQITRIARSVVDFPGLGGWNVG